MRILALDVATTTGWCANGLIYGDQKFTDQHRPAKLKAYSDWVREIIAQTEPDLVGYEVPVLRGGPANELLLGMAGITQATAYDCGCAVAPACRPMTLKKYWTGTGKADKDLMIATCRARGYEPASDHQADAIALWHYLDEKADTMPRKPAVAA